ncbi:hypothetical protein DV738_g3252, partial [Chaetothyriales sp. CBS 135597]
MLSLRLLHRAPAITATLLRPACRSLLPATTRRTLRTPPGQSRRQAPPSSSSPPPANHDGPAPESGAAAPAPSPPSMASILAQTSDQDNSLLAPVHIPEDPKAVLKSDHPARQILAESGIVVQRQIEMMNVFLGFEQANRYIILGPHGQQIGYLAEHDGGIGKAMGRQWFRTHRSFTAHVFDRHGQEVLRFHRPFSWINSTIRVFDAQDPAAGIQLSTATDLTLSQAVEQLHRVSPLPLEAMRVVGEAQSEWAPLRRKYSLFLARDSEQTGLAPNTASASIEMAQFARIDEPFLSWDFSLLDADNRLLGSVNRSFRGFAREIFTDTGAYVLRMDSAGLEQEAEKSHTISQTHQTPRSYAEAVGGLHDNRGMTLDQRAVMLATAVTVDFDYFSRHSSAGSSAGFFPIWMGGGGEAAGGAAGGAAAGGAAEAGAAGAGAVVGGAGRAVGGAATGASEIGIGEGAMAGAGSLAGYEAMQRGMGRNTPDSASPQTPEQPYGAQQPFDDPYTPPSMQSGTEGGGPDVWGGDNDPWQAAGEGGTGGEGGGFFNWLWENFFGD